MQEEYLDQSILLASFVQDNFRKDLNRKNRGVKQSGFWVYIIHIWILIEAGFMTNPNEGVFLNSKKGQSEISNSIFNAIEKYKTSLGFSNEKNNYSNNTNLIIYKVQIAASKKKVELKSYNFKGLKNLSRVKQGSIYKYFFSSSKSLNEIERKKEHARSKGFTNAYIVGFENCRLFEVEKLIKFNINS